MAHVTVINEHQHVQQIVSGHHYLTADATASAGGTDAGFAPRELMLASLGACTAIALRENAGRNGWALGEITIGLRWSRDASGQDHIDRRLSFTKPLTDDQKKQLLEIAAQSLITKVLLNAITIQSSVVD
jgi:putative redox protein